MNTDQRHVRLPLTTLIEFLEGVGFHIGIDLRLKLQEVLFSFGDEYTIDDLDELKYYIRPLVVKSQNQQRLFDNAFEKYTQYIESRSAAFELRLTEPEPTHIGEMGKRSFGKYKKAMFFILGPIAFLIFAYYMNLRREPPSVSMILPEWVMVNDSLTIDGQVEGFLFVKACIRINDTLKESRSWLSPENENISFANAFQAPGEYTVQLKAHNSFTKKDTLSIHTIEVCEFKPLIDFEYSFNPTNPLEVTFEPEILNTAGDFSMSLSYNGSTIYSSENLKDTAKKFVHEFVAPNTYEVELRVENTSNASNSLCDQTVIRKVINLKSVILGLKLDLLSASMNEGKADSLLINKSDFKVGVIQYKNGEGITDTYKPIFDSLVNKLDNYENLEFKLFGVKSLTDSLLNGDLHIGVFTVEPYLIVTEKHPELTAMLTHHIDGKSYFNGYVISSKKSKIRNLADLRNKHFTYFKRTSTSGYKLPKGIFEILGHRFENFEFSHDYNESIKRLLDEKTDGVAIDEARWKEAGADTLKLQKIHKFKTPYNAYVFSSRLSKIERDQIKTLLIDSVKINPDNPLGIEKLIPINDEHYNTQRRYLGKKRKKPRFVFDTDDIRIVEDFNDTKPKWVDKLEDNKVAVGDSIRSLIKRSNRFAIEERTRFNFRGNLTLKNNQDETVTYSIFLNNSEFIGTGKISTDDLETKLPGLFVNSIINALPIEAEIFQRSANDKKFILYGKNDGINIEDYVYTVGIDTIKKNDITLSEKETYFTNLDKSASAVKITYPSPNSNTAQYFRILDMNSWARISNSDRNLVLLTILFIIGLFACIELFYFRKRKTIPSQDMAAALKFDGIKPPYDLELPNHNHKIRPEKELYDVSRMLKHRRDAGTSKIDVFESIKGTAENAGFIDLIFKETTKVPEYLVVIDRSSSETFHIELFQYLKQFLQNEDVLLDAFYFNNTPKNLKNHEHPEGISLESLFEKYPDHTLLLISDGNKLMNTKLDRVFKWASEILPKWESRFILTPKNFSEWDRKEDLIDHYIPILPVTLQGLLYMSESLTLKQLPDLNKRIADLQLKRDASFYSFDSIEGIKEFLKDPILFQWFCCLAIYPKIHWQFVVAIGKGIEAHHASSGSDFSLNYQSLYEICEVAHLLDDDMDNDLRIELMEQLESDYEAIARQSILQVLDTLRIPEDSYAFREVMVQAKVNHSLLNPDKLQSTKDLFYLWENNLIEDSATRSYLSESTNNLWNKKAEDFFGYVNYRNWKHLAFSRGPIYLGAIYLILIILNMTLFQEIIKPMDPIFEPKKETQEKIGKNVSYAAILNNQAVEVYGSGEVNDAISLLDSALKRDPSLYKARHNIDVVEFNKAIDNYLNEDFKSAITILSALEHPMDTIAFEESKEQKPYDSFQLNVRHYLGLSNFYLNQPEKARDYLDMITTIDSTFLNRYDPNLSTILRKESVLDLANTFFEKFDYVRAQEFFLEAINQGFESADIYGKLGYSYYYTNNYKDAVLWYTRGIEKYPNINPADILRLAKALKTMGSYKESEIWMSRYNDLKSKRACLTTVKGTVTNENTGDIIIGAKVSIIDENGKVLSYITTSKSGQYSVDLDCGEDLTVQGENYDFRPDLKTINTGKGQDKVVNLALVPPVIYSSLAVINPVYFDFDRFNIRKDAQIELQNIVRLMQQNPEMFLKIEGHTSSRGTDADNQQISERRAASVRDYMISRGVESERLSSVGYGESQLLNECGNEVKCTEEEHSLNNRVSFNLVDQKRQSPVQVDRGGNPINNENNLSRGDKDGDGVLDKDDKCPDEIGTVANNGCPEVGVPTQEIIFSLNNYAKAITFDTGKSSFGKGTYSVLQAITEILKEYPASSFTIEGHSDSVGSAKVNQLLTERRANAIRDYLVENGINPEKLIAIGYGEESPVGDNKTKAGRANNRRIEIKLNSTSKN